MALPNRTTNRTENEISGWQLVECLGRSPGVEYWKCRPSTHSPTPADAEWYFAKVYTAKATRDAEYVEREASIAAACRSSGFIDLRESFLDSRPCLLVYSWFYGTAVDRWLASQAQAPPTPTLLWMARQLLERLSALHAYGYVHGNVRPEHVLVGTRDEVTLVGLGNCELVGEVAASNRSRTRFDAPETAGEYECSSAQDIFAAGVVIGELIGERFLKTEIAKAMMGDDPDLRPCAVELIPLFLEFEMQLFGRHLRAA